LKAVGLMSGTSVDGVDAALVDIRERSGRIKVKLIAFLTRAYPAKLRKRLLFVSEPGSGSSVEIAELNVRIGKAFARAALEVCIAADVDISSIDFIASHGQTIAHFPAGGATLQIGEGAVIAARTGAPVVTDFRQADLAVRGQGAPLTPMADFHFFRHARKNRVVVNVGGITNVTVLPRGIESIDDITGFDTGFGNMVLDGMARIITRGKASYDKGGRLARKGKVREDWLDTIFAHRFFRKKPPKSTGREEFGAAYLEALQKRLKAGSHRARLDLIATLTAAVARTTVRAVDKFAMPIREVDEVLICGGGARNPTLVQHFSSSVKPAGLMFTDESGVPADAREAMAFALLGYLTVKRRPGNVPAVTGARKTCILGKLVFP